MGQESHISFPTVGKLEDELPTAEWTTEQLGRYAQCQDDVCTGLGRKMAVHRFREGHALTLAHERIDYGLWTPFLNKYGISHSSADRARKLYAKAKDEKNLEGRTIMDAYEEFEIDRPAQTTREKPQGSPPAKRSALTGSPPKQHLPAAQQRHDEPEPPRVTVMSVEATEQDDSTEVDCILREFNEFAEVKGWDEARKLQVMAELSFPDDPLRGMVTDLVTVGSGDEMLAQLHQYYSQEPDLWSLVEQGKASGDQMYTAIIAKCEQLKKVAIEQIKEQGGQP